MRIRVGDRVQLSEEGRWLAPYFPAPVGGWEVTQINAIRSTLSNVTIWILHNGEEVRFHHSFVERVPRSIEINNLMSQMSAAFVAQNTNAFHWMEWDRPTVPPIITLDSISSVAAALQQEPDDIPF